MEVKAEAKYIRVSPRKMRLVADLVRNMPLESALVELSASTKRAAEPISKLIKSAIANAENNFKLKRENLYLKSIEIDQGIGFKRWRAVSKGTAHGYKKITSHAKVILGEKKEEKQKNKVKGKEKNGTKNKS